MDAETKRLRRDAAHQALAQRHPVWEVYGRRWVLPLAGLALAAVVLAWLVRQAWHVASSSDLPWAWIAVPVICLVLLAWLVSRLRNPMRVPRRFR